ncbi:MAG: chromosome segregation protein SMC [Desulfitobacteriaceae bacterium]|nr:chromosome segregation protein SMC [Desulfitobacteriaceae bacterium]MDI6878584.1 chromosome segregation protein SMC [Desulfitobacteriaceae bacterium]MDI6913662.1 chromosome segregation protein SMC [Desulfitobacteriaceae bacterium]
MAKAENLPIFLKSISIQGFKSFADRVRLELQQGLSVIVGPNGSGKSNVADAVRWVLGEQSAKTLRGSKMEDVIFAGTTKRRSVGMAEVSLVFDNMTGIFPLDFREVTITRRVYRDGESQYLINRSPCRLKDVQELFLDTGAGKEGFSIIGQGRVEEILNSKAEERRLIIEEAAGISKYRMRKREALKRLDDTEHNLQRLADILREIESRIGPLAEQAEVAKQSAALQEEQRRLEIQWIVGDLAEVQTKLAAAREEEESFRVKEALLQSELAQGEAESTTLRIQEKDLESAVQEKQQEAFAAEQAVSRCKHEMTLLQERSGYVAQQAERLAAELSQGSKRLDLFKERAQSLENKKRLLERTVAEARQEVGKKEEALSRAKEQSGVQALERIKEDLFAALSEQASCSNKVTGIRHTLGSREQQSNQLQAECLDKEGELALLKVEQEADADKESSLQKTRKETEVEIARLQQEQLHSAEISERLEKELRVLRGEIERTDAKRHALQALEDSLEGYSRGVKEVLAAKKRGVADCQGLCGAVADLIRVDKPYELALETALGPALQHIVAESMQEAKRNIAYLKVQKAGWATFLPLDTVQGSRFQGERGLTDPDFIGLAVDLAHFEARYRPAMDYLLGRILVVKDMDAATRVAKTFGYKVRIVTLDGDQIHPGGTLTGGSVQRKGSQLLGRARELEGLKQRVSELRTEGEEKNKALTGASQHMEGLEARLAELKTRGQALREKLAVLEEGQKNRKVRTLRLEEELRLAAVRQADLLEAKEEALSQFEAGLSEQKEWDSRVEALRLGLQETQSQAERAQGEMEHLSESLTEARVQLAKWEQELSQARTSLQEETAKCQEQEASLKELAENLERVKQQGDGIENELAALALDLAAAQDQQRDNERSLVRLRQEREQVSLLARNAEEMARKAQKEAAGFSQRRHAHELNLARWETEWEGGTGRLTEEFNLSWEEASAFKPEQERHILWPRLQAIKGELEALGPVNQAAIVEYPKLLERQGFLLTQEEDLVQASQKLKGLIAELDKTMSERFKEGFEAVNEAFREVFKELFDGGQAELRLVDPDNLLESGVDIVAQPPGKKLQWLSLLSGGERALTAIALLFALLRVKPSPFCLLDEIEASLDDANVKRFAEYIQRLSHFTQFVVISHRKGTMEAANMLYGITMEESGVSKLLSVEMDTRLRFRTNMVK